MPHECTNCGRVFADGSKQMLSGCPDCGGNKFQFKPATAVERDDPQSATDERSPESAVADPTGTARDRDDASPDSAGARRDLSEDSTEWPDHGYGPGTADSTPSSDAADPDTSAAGAPATDTSATDTSVADPEAAPTDSDAATEHGTAETTDPAADAVEAPDTSDASDDSAEDPAQADARTDVVSPDEIAAATPEETEGTATSDSPGSPPADADGAAGRTPEPIPDDRPDLDDLREELNEQFESIRIVAPGEYELNLMELYDRTEYIISLQEDGRYVIEVPDTWDTTPDPDGT